MQLISINSAAATATADLVLNVTYTDDAEASQTVDYGWIGGDPYGLGPQIDAYMAAHPDVVANATPYVAPPITGADVDAERARRRLLPVSVTVPSGTFTVNMDDTAQANIQGLSTVGLYLKQAAPTQTTVFRDFANVSHNLSPDDLIALGMSVAAHVQALYVASWALKAMSPIPTDYAADSHWS